MKKYLVCYYYTSKEVNGFSNIIATCKENDNICTEEEIMKLQEQLCIAYSYTSVSVQNIIKLDS